MKKALAILMTIALVSMVAFADGATITAAPKVTYGVTGSAETDLASGNTIAVTAPGKSVAATDALAVKSEPLGLGGNGLFNTQDWINLDWSNLSIKATGKYDAFRSADDDAKDSGYSVTTTVKNFFGFQIQHVYGFDDRNDSTVTTNTPALAKNNNNNVTVTTTPVDGVKLWTKYNANTIFGLANVAFAGEAVEGIFDGFTQLGFEYDTPEFYSKLLYNNTPANTAGSALSSAAPSSQTPSLSTQPAQAGKIDTAIIEARKMFGIWTVRINDSGDNKFRINNLGSDCNFSDVNFFNIGTDYQIQHDGSGLVTDASHKVGLNIRNVITPMDGLNIYVHALAPYVSKLSGTAGSPSTNLTVADWLNGGKLDGTARTSNLVFGASYVLANVGTVDAGVQVNNDYIKNVNGLEGPTDLLGNVNTTTGAITTAAVNWNNSFWLGAKLDKLLGANKATYIGLDMSLGSFIDATATNKDWLAQTDLNKSHALTVGNATKTVLQLETKDTLLGDGVAAGSLTVNAGIKATLFGGVAYGQLNSLPDGTSVKAKDFNNDYLNDAATGLKATGNNNWISANYTEGNFMNQYYGTIGTATSPFGLQARADYIVSPVIKNVYIKDSYTALAGTLGAAGTTVAGGRVQYGYFDKNTITLGTSLAATKKGTLGASASYNMFLGLPAASDLYSTGASDAAKKLVDQNLAATYGSGTFSPVSLHVTYTFTF